MHANIWSCHVKTGSCIKLETTCIAHSPYKTQHPTAFTIKNVRSAVNAGKSALTYADPVSAENKNGNSFLNAEDNSSTKTSMMEPIELLLLDIFWLTTA